MEANFGGTVSWRAAARIVVSTISMRGRVRSIAPPTVPHYPAGEGAKNASLQITGSTAGSVTGRVIGPLAPVPATDRLSRATARVL